MASLLAPALGSQVPGTKKSPRWSVRKAHFVTTKARRSALHLPSKGEIDQKLKLARRRENASAWLFEIRIGEFSRGGDKHSAVVPANPGTHTLRRHDAEGVSNLRL